MLSADWINNTFLTYVYSYFSNVSRCCDWYNTCYWIHSSFFVIVHLLIQQIAKVQNVIMEGPQLFLCSYSKRPVSSGPCNHQSFFMQKNSLSLINVFLDNFTEFTPTPEIAHKLFRDLQVQKDNKLERILESAMTWLNKRWITENSYKQNWSGHEFE